VEAAPGVYQVQVQILSGSAVLLVGEPSPQILRLGPSVNPGGGVGVPLINAVRFSLEQPGGSVALGVAYVGVSGDNSAEVRFNVLAYSSAGLSPIAKYGIVVTVNGTSYTAGIMTVNGDGTATASGSVQLPPGNYRTYFVGIEVLSGTSEVLAGEPTPQTLVFHPQVVSPPVQKTLYFTFVAVDGRGSRGRRRSSQSGPTLGSTRPSAT